MGEAIQGEATKKPLPLMTEKMYEYNGIKVAVRINFKQKTISLVEDTGPEQEKMKIKNWTFARRGLEYIQPWQRILTAMGYAIRDASAELQEYEDRLAQEALEFAEALNENDHGE